MTNTIETLESRVANAIIERTNNCTKSYTATMKYDGEKIEIVPCLYDDTKEGLENVEYWLIYSHHPWVSSSKFEDIVDYFTNYEDYCNKDLDEKAQLKAYYDKYFASKSSEQIRAEQTEINDIIIERRNVGITIDNGLYDDLPDYGDWNWYSDWHKDCYGYRPNY